MIRFIHAADIHLDSPMQGIKSQDSGIDQDIYKKSTRKALINLVDYALKEKVDFITLGGDNYDGNFDSYETALFFQEQIARLDHIPVVAITGNHDAASKITLKLHLPKNYKLLSDEAPEVFDVLTGVRVIGQGFRNQSEKRNLAERYPQRDGHGITIGLLHTSLDGREGHDNYAPCSTSDLLSKNYHFWGLGHIHKSEWIGDSGETNSILFPGNLQGRSVRETGPKGAYLIEMNDDGEIKSSHFEPMDVTRWFELDISVEDCNTDEDIWQKTQIELQREFQNANGRTLAGRINFTGMTPLHMNLLDMQVNQDNRILSEAQQAAANAAPQKIWIQKVKIRTMMPVDRITIAPFLQDFINQKSESAEWISSFLQREELLKLKQQLGIVKNPEHRNLLEQNFSEHVIQQLIHDIPTLLENVIFESNRSKAQKEV